MYPYHRGEQTLDVQIPGPGLALPIPATRPDWEAGESTVVRPVAGGGPVVAAGGAVASTVKRAVLDAAPNSTISGGQGGWVYVIPAFVFLGRVKSIQRAFIKFAEPQLVSDWTRLSLRTFPYQHDGVYGGAHPDAIGVLLALPIIEDFNIFTVTWNNQGSITTTGSMQMALMTTRGGGAGLGARPSELFPGALQPSDLIYGFKIRYQDESPPWGVRPVATGAQNQSWMFSSIVEGYLM